MAHPVIRHKKKTIHSDAVISLRDQQTLSRLLRRIGRRNLIDFIETLPDAKTLKGKSGAPRTDGMRRAFLAVLYLCRLSKGPVSIPVFARRIQQVVDIRYSRRLPPNYTQSKSVEALERDLRRGLSEDAGNTLSGIVHGLVWWRFNHVNPRWGFTASSGRTHLRIEPKNPAELVSWIDGAIARAGVRDELQQGFQKFVSPEHSGMPPK
jgi:hypothetical protein